MDSNLAKKLRHTLEVLHYMLRRGMILKRKLVLDLNLHLKRTKLTTKRLRKRTTLSHGVQPRTCRRFEFDFSDVVSYYGGDGSGSGSVLPSPSPLIVGSNARRCRVTDSPFVLMDEGGLGDDGRVDEKAEDFIRRFYEQLRMQQSRAAMATPECCHGFQ